ncbi:protein of unknown function (DUF4203) domain containing protein [Naviculisporaceae sp. PSN 640]
MRVAGYTGAKALICFCFLVNIALAGVAQPARRQDTSLTTTLLPTETSRDNERGPEVTSVLSDDTTSTSSTSRTSTIPDIPENTSTVNTTVLEFSEDVLPLSPEITPGFAVAGVIMICTGFVYAMVGIKTRWIHSFLSTAFLGSLGTSVLIVYVTTPPVGRAVQGAYVVAVVCTGAILGGLAIIFKEVTECLACLLGGFCLSMWLLTLQSGGLIHHTGGKVGFIAAFTLAGFGLYFTPWTRNYGMIACISFSGATVAVLGIDCFSRAGYKEFWAYLWALNEYLFPLGTTTYPLTRGIRVEIAVTILIFLAGVVSQLRLWRVIKDRRSKREAERAEGERTLRAEEENIGRQIEKMTARERRRWERSYGDNTISPLGATADARVTGVENEKRMHVRTSVVSASASGARSQSPSGTDAGTGILEFTINETRSSSQMTKINAVEKVLLKDDDGARITVMVAQDDMPSGPIFQDPVITRPKEAHLAVCEVDSKQQDEYFIPPEWQNKSLAREFSPNITSLPFTIPEEHMVEAAEEEDRSSIATFADKEEGGTPRLRSTSPQRLTDDSVINKLSSGSANLLRSLSQRSKRNNDEQVCPDTERGESRENLVVDISQAADAKDESDSVVANLDDLSYISDLVSLNSWEVPQEYQLDPKLPAAKSPEEGDSKDVVGDARQHNFSQPKPEQNGPADWTSSSGSSTSKYSDGRKTVPNQVYSSLMAAKSGPTLGSTQAQEDRKQDETVPEQAASSRDGGERAIDARRTSMDSVAASLTMGNLPSGLSRVAMSYRTNEWAKHLSAAETPEPEILLVGENPADDSYSDASSEDPAPVDVAELAQTAENAAPPPAAPRSASALSNYRSHTVTRSDSRTSLSQPYRSLSGILKGKASGVLAQPIAEEGADGNINGHRVPAAVPEEGSLTSGTPRDTSSPRLRKLSTPPTTPDLSAWLGGISPPSPQQTQTGPQTLIGMREMLLRTKASTGLLATPTPAEALYTNMSSPDLLRRTPFEAGSMNNHNPYAAGVGADLDDADEMPLSQRRAMIRQSSLGSFVSVSNSVPGASKQHPYRSHSKTSIQSQYNRTNSPQTPTAEGSSFDSHQPARKSKIPTPAAREAQLANFRSSVAADLRAASPIEGANPGRWDSPSPGPMMNYGSSPYGQRHASAPAMLNPSFGLPGGFTFNGAGASNAGGGGGLGNIPIPTASMQSLRGAYTYSNMNLKSGGSGSGGMAEAQRTLETQRSFLMEQKEIEMARREAERIEAERGQREFEERMRSGQLMGAHRDALRRMQARVRE